MLYEEERKRMIVEYVRQQGRASVQELAQLLQVSDSTIRRDLKDLEEEQQLQRTHGGAVPLFQADDDPEPSFLEKEDRFRQQKQAIAETAYSLIREGDTVLLDSGTTTYYLAKLLHGIKKLTVVTNSIVVARELANDRSIEIILTGGTLRPETQAMVGPFAERNIGMIHADKLFLATNGFDAESGLTTPNMIEASVKSKMIRSARQVILLADHSKYGRVSFVRFGELFDVNCIVTDSGISSAAVADIEAADIELIIAGCGGGDE